MVMINTTDTTTLTPPAMPLAVTVACDIASGAVTADPASPGLEITTKHRDLNCKLKGPEWYRLVLRNGAWTYIGSPLPKISGMARASERRASSKADVYEGELIAQHDKGGSVDAMYLVVTEGGTKANGHLLPVEWIKGRNGLRVILPTGAHVTVPNPRR